MTTTKKTKVATAESATVQSFHDETMENVRRIEDAATGVEEGRKAIMQSLYVHYSNAIAPASKGGLSGNAMRTSDSMKAEASRLNLTVGAVRELHGIIKAINEVRANVWQDYQRAFFGRNEKASAPKDESDAVKALKAEKAEHEGNAAASKIAAKEIELEIMKAKDEGEKAQLQKKLKTYRSDAKYFTEQAKDCAQMIKEEAEFAAGSNAYGALCEALKKLSNKYASHKDEAVAELAKQVLALM